MYCDKFQRGASRNHAHCHRGRLLSSHHHLESQEINKRAYCEEKIGEGGEVNLVIAQYKERNNAIGSPPSSEARRYAEIFSAQCPAFIRLQ